MWNQRHKFARFQSLANLLRINERAFINSWFDYVIGWKEEIRYLVRGLMNRSQSQVTSSVPPASAVPREMADLLHQISPRTTSLVTRQTGLLVAEIARREVRRNMIPALWCKILKLPGNIPHIAHGRLARVAKDRKEDQTLRKCKLKQKEVAVIEALHDCEASEIEGCTLLKPSLFLQRRLRLGPTLRTSKDKT